jgi:type I toxin-antitoxin system toxin SymE
VAVISGARFNSFRNFGAGAQVGKLLSANAIALRHSNGSPGGIAVAFESVSVALGGSAPYPIGGETRDEKETIRQKCSRAPRRERRCPTFLSLPGQAHGIAHRASGLQARIDEYATVHTAHQIRPAQMVIYRVDTATLVSDLLERRLTEAQPQTIKVGRTYQGGFSANSRVPFIRLSGRWLAEAGFSEGDVVQISVALGEIRLKWQSGSAHPK